MQDDVIKVARAIFESDGQSWSEVGTAWPWYLDAARAAMAATREIDAKALHLALQSGEVGGRSYETADWLQQRANDVKETGRG